MDLKSGTRLAHYEILEPIGRGGMGEVYRAKDSKLGRDVAIKVLPDEFAQDEERLRRFQREAKVLASLNHPNIAAIYGLEQTSDTHYLVLELVPGETLAERISRGPIPVDEALGIATKIAEALEEAHEQGIVHRDLKPANVKLTPDDKVKVLDFGLAKAFAEDGAEGDAATSMSPTITRDATRMGVILGTAAYMSPEQAKGKRVDKRTDIWAFGTVLYEMLTGHKAFAGEDVSDTLAAVLRSEPDFGALPADVSPAVLTALARSLEKNPKERWRDIADVRLAMAGTFGSVPFQASGAGGSSRWRVAPLVTVAVALATGLAVWALMRPQQPSRPTSRFIVTAPPSANLFVAGESHELALSPDGSWIVYRSGVGGGRSWLYKRRLDELEGTRIESAGGGLAPFFSPDGAWIGFMQINELKKIPVEGGAAVTIATLPSGSGIRGASWGRDGMIVFASNWPEALYRVPEAGGEPEVLFKPDGAWVRWPEILPNGKAILVTILPGGGPRENPQPQTAQIAVLDLETSQVTPLLSGTHPRYTPTGHIVYGGGDGTLRAVPFASSRREVTGSPVTLVEGVMTKRGGATNFAVAANGSLVYATGSAQRRSRLVWVDRTGREELIETEPLTFDLPRLSPDGRRVAVGVEEAGNVDLRVVDLERGTVVRLTRAPEEDISPMWTADGNFLIFGSSRDGGGIFRIAADGTGAVEHLADGLGGRIPLPHAWSRDGKRLVFYESGGPTVGDIFTLAVDSHQVDPLLASPELLEAHPSVSPDGRWIAYSGNDSGPLEVYVRPFPNVNDGRELISTDGGNEPLWSPDGRELFYWNDATRSMMAVEVTLEPTFRAWIPRALFEGDYLFPLAGRHYDVSADGRRFLMVKAAGEDDERAMGQGQIVYVQNWFSELQRLVPTNR